MGGGGRIASFWTGPSEHVVDPVQRGAARLLASCLILITLSFALLDLVLTLTREGYEPPYVGYVLLGFGYLLARTRHFRLGAVLVTIMFTGVSIALALDEEGSLASLAFSAVAPLFAGIFLGLRGVLVVGLSNPLIVALVPWLSRGRYSPDDVVVPVFATLVIGVIAILHTTHRDWVERTRVRALEIQEAQLQQMQKMEAIGRFAGGIAHDFNNLLTVIAGGVDLLGRREKSRELTLIDSATRSARELTSQLLTLSRQGVVDHASTNVPSLVRSIRDLLVRVIGEDIEVRVSLQDDLADVAIAPGRLEQVLLNLATNARDAMPRGGTLEIAAENFDGGVRLSVRDTGTGMDDATRRRIFEPFFTTKELGKGTGLGLAIVFGVVVQSGGEVQVESELGRGTTFRIWLPSTDGPRELALSERKILVPRSGEGCILLVEDDEAVRGLCEMVLRDAGYDVLSAESPAEARSIFEKESERIELVVCDLIMPGSSGPEVIREFHDAVPELPVLYMSGYAPEQLGAVPIDSRLLLPKPFRPTDLLNRVAVLLTAGPPLAASHSA